MNKQTKPIPASPVCPNCGVLVEAIKAMQAACDEWAAEFTQHKRAMNWGIVNDAYIKAEKAIRKVTEGVQ